MTQRDVLTLPLTGRDLVIVYVVSGVIFGLCCAYVAGTKGRSRGSWFIVGFFFNIFALIAVRLSSKAKRGGPLPAVERVVAVSVATPTATVLPDLAVPQQRIDPSPDPTPLVGPLTLACHIPVCATGGSTERCGRCGRLACAAHRTLRNGTYICVTCDAEAAESQRIAQRALAEQERVAAVAASLAREAEAARELEAYRRSRDPWLLWGNAIMVVLAPLMAVGMPAQAYHWMWGGRLQFAVPEGSSALSASFVLQVWILAAGFLALGIIALHGLVTTGFRHGRLDEIASWRRTLYRLVAVPGILFAVVTVVGIIVIMLVGGSAASSASGATKDDRLRGAVRDGVDDALRGR